MDGLVVVVGGGGFVGRYLVQALAKTNVRIRVVARNPQAASFVKPLGGVGQIQIVPGNVQDPRTLASAFEGATAGVNLAGILAERAGSVSMASRLQAPAMLRRPPRRRASRHSCRFRQSLPRALRRCLCAHQGGRRGGGAGRAAARDDRTPVDRLRARGSVHQPLRGAHRSPVVPVVAGRTRFQPVYVVDVAHAITNALTDPARHGGRTYAAGRPEDVQLPRDPDLHPRPGAARQDTGRSARRRCRADGEPRQLRARRADDEGPVADAAERQRRRGRRARAGELGVEPTPLESIAPAYLERYKTGGRFTAIRGRLTFSHGSLRGAFASTSSSWASSRA